MQACNDTAFGKGVSGTVRQSLKHFVLSLVACLNNLLPCRPSFPRCTWYYIAQWPLNEWGGGGGPSRALKFKRKALALLCRLHKHYPMINREVAICCLYSVRYFQQWLPYVIMRWVYQCLWLLCFLLGCSHFCLLPQQIFCDFVCFKTSFIKPPVPFQRGALLAVTHWQFCHIEPRPVSPDRKLMCSGSKGFNIKYLKHEYTAH